MSEEEPRQRQGYYPRDTIPGDYYWYIGPKRELSRAGKVVVRPDYQYLELFSYHNLGAWMPLEDALDLRPDVILYPAQDDHGFYLGPPGSTDVLLPPEEDPSD